MIIRKGEHIKKSILNEDAVIYKKFESDFLEINIYVMNKGGNFYFVPPETPGGVKVYFIISGHLKNTTSDDHLYTNDSIILQPGDDYYIFSPEEDSIAYVSTYGDQAYERTKKRFALTDITMESIEKKDHYTNQHCLKVLELAREMARRMKLNGKESYAFVTAARYHDLGKISISDEILNKPGPLTEDQYNDMKNHVIETRRLLSENFEEEVCLIAEQHHERLNGSGYPYGLKAKDIHEHAKALAVLDTFDAMTTDRIYKKGKTREEAFLELYTLADTHYERKYIEMLELIIFKADHPQ